MMKLTGPIVFLLLLVSLKGHAQSSSSAAPGPFKDPVSLESFVPFEAMKKVIVCTEDLSVWAISAAGKVYFKTVTDADFSEFNPTSGIEVTDLAGYNKNEMYFLASTGKLYHSANGAVVTEVAVTGSFINNIAIVNAEHNVYLENYRGKRDWLAIAARSGVYMLFRDNGVVEPYTPISVGSTPDCKILNSSFKSIDFQYDYNALRTCFGDVKYSYFHGTDPRSPAIILPEDPPDYTGPVNCTLFEKSFNSKLDGNAVVDYWGTDKGLFFKKSSSCDPTKVQFKDLGKVYDLEELNFMRELFNAKVLLTASSTGLYMSMLSADALTIDSRIQNLPFKQLFSGVVNGIASEVNTNESSVTADNYQLCERVIWLATSTGIKRLPVIPLQLQTDFSDMREQNKILTVSPDHGIRYNGIRYDNLCNGNEYTVTVNMPLDKSKYTIKWLMDEDQWTNRVEHPEWYNLSAVTSSIHGFFGVEITLACGDVIRTAPVWLRYVPDPVFSFNNYPDVLPFCELSPTVLVTDQTTDRGLTPYVFQWVKNGGNIENATNNTYTATTPGIYRVDIQNCYGAWIPSKSVELKPENAVAPVISRSSTNSLCFGETVTLSVPLVSGQKYRWNTGESTNEILANKSGNYYVEVSTDFGCPQKSEVENVTIKEELKLTPPAQVQICTITNQQLKLTAPEGFTKYTWAGVSGTNNFLNVSAPGVYALQVEDAAGCTANASYIVVPYCPPPIPPNAFSPNGDGVNDTWTVVELNNDPAATLKIYNRNGALIFTGTNLKRFWDGKFKGADSPVGTYYYVVTQKSSAKVLTGSLMLIR